MNDVFLWAADHTLWLLLAANVTALLLLDNKYHETRSVTLKSSVGFSLWYILQGIAFGAVIAVWYGEDMAVKYYTAYLMEKALSVDNLVVFMMVFDYFDIKHVAHRHKVLYYGIMGAIVFRLIFVLAGSAALEAWGQPVEIALGLVILYSAYRIVRAEDAADIDHESKWYIRWTRHVAPVTSAPHRGHFFLDVYPERQFAARHKVRHGTTLLLAAVAVELCDVMFAFDSVPTVLAIVHEPLVVYSAMIFAILGLRALYFVLEAAKDRVPALKWAVVVLLAFIGVKLIVGAAFGVHIRPSVSLTVTLVILTIGFIPWRKSGN